MSFLNLKRRLLAFKYALQGLKWAFSSQPNLWIHLLATICVIILAFYFHLKPFHWVILVFCIVSVFTVELINTAIEWLVDSIYKERHSLAGKIKDVAAAAVLITSLGAAIIGIIIFYPYIMKVI